MLKEKIIDFKKNILDKKYYEAHEDLEEIWFPIRKEKSDLSLLLKGFINGAVSMELHKRKRFLQSKNIHRVYLKYVTFERMAKTEFQKDFLELQVFMDEEFLKIL